MSEEPDPRRWRILGVSLAVGFMSLLDVTIVNVAIPSMQRGLETTASSIQWVVSGYALSFGLLLVAGGRLGDAYGRRRLMLVGLAAFVTSSALVGLAPSAELVIVARLLQGASAGLLTPQNSGLIQQLFTGAERGRAFGLFGFTVSVASAAGPVVGGGIIALAGDDDGWRWLFLVNVPIGVVAAFFVLRLVPGPSEPPSRQRIDVAGALLLGGAVLCLLFPIVSIEAGRRLPLLLLVGVPLLGWAFVAWEHRTLRRGQDPLLDLALLRRTPGFAGGLAVGTLYFTGFTGILLVLSVHLQDVVGLTALQAGLLVTPFAVGSAVAAPLVGRVVTTIGRPLTVAGLVAMMVGVLLVALLVPGRDAADLWWTMSPCLLLAGLGGGAVVSPNITLTLAEVPPRMGGAAGGALQTGQRIGASIGAALLATLFAVHGLRLALLAAIAVLLVALALAVVALRTARRAGHARAPAHPEATTAAGG